MMFGLVLILVLALAFNLLIFTIFPLLLIFFFYHTTNDNTTKRKEKPMLQTPLIAKKTVTVMAFFKFCSSVTHFVTAVSSSEYSSSFPSLLPINACAVVLIT